MQIKTLTAQKFRQMIKASAIILQKHAKYINSLNVFPVPDGDTGTNISLTTKSGAEYVAKDKSNSIGKLSQDFSEGLLMGARGNSGVITSQIFRGWSDAIKDKDSLTAQDIAKAFSNGAKIAYQSVMNPTEGTILSVIRKVSQTGNSEVKDSDDIVKLFEIYNKEAERALKQTTNELPVLKKVGVVDSGGQGLTLIIKAWNNEIQGKGIEDIKKPTPEEMNELIQRKHQHSAQGKLNPKDIKYQYCTQMTVRFGRGKFYDKKFSYQPFYDYLASLGNSLLVANDKKVVKVHVHTNTPWKVLKFGQHYGDLTKVKVDNMVKQQEDMIKKTQKKNKLSNKQANKNKNVINIKEVKPNIFVTKNNQNKHKTGLIIICTGDGMRNIFNKLGASVIINGGQTMNPSTRLIIDAIKQLNANDAIILPNNSNVFMSTKMACQKINQEQSNQSIQYLKTKNMQEGIASLLGYNPSGKAKDNVKAMKDSIDCNSGEVTTASRNQNIDGYEVSKGAVIGISNHKIIATGGDVAIVTKDTIEKIIKQTDLASEVDLFYQKKWQKKMLEKISQKIQQNHNDLDIILRYGGQSVYNVLVSVE